jgi:hypothetical protein
LSKNNFADRCHLVKIKVSDGLFYYIEVRPRPGTTTQIFDDSIPLNGATNDGGVIVTKVYTDVVNINQQIRFISLLHEPVVLKNGETAIDPARDLTITVENEGLVARPLVCRVRVQWAQNIEDVPDGSFDLRIEPWDSDYQTPDIWIDRIPYGTFDNLLDTQGRPFDTGDKPRPNEINHFYARVHNDGADKAKNVNVTFYSVEPPGIGDNGNWGPLETKTIASIDANSHEDISSNWTPIIDRHTCLKVFIQQQLGEVQGNNNQAQENVFHFEAPASSRPKSIVMPVAVRNPLNRQTLVMINVRSVPKGYTVQFPHRWLWLNPKQEKTFNFIIILINDYWWYREKYAKNITAKINLLGRIPRSYREKIPPNVMPASRMLPIGGITVKVTPKQNVKIELKANGEHYKIHATGKIIPGLQSEVLRVDATDPYGYCRYKNCTTNSAGNFSAIIDVTEPATGNDILPPGHPHLYPIHGKYRVQARIINSPNAAQAESNIIFINFS